MMRLRGPKQPRHPAPSVSGAGGTWESLPYDTQVYPDEIPADSTQTIDYMMPDGLIDLRLSPVTEVYPNEIPLSLAETEMIPKIIEPIDFPPGYLEEAEAAWEEKINLLPDYSMTLAGSFTTAPPPEPEPEHEALPTFADAVMNIDPEDTTSDVIVPRLAEYSYHAAIIIIIDRERFLLSTGSLPEQNLILLMETSVDETLLSIGYRRNSAWGWVTGYLTCDIIPDV